MPGRPQYPSSQASLTQTELSEADMWSFFGRAELSSSEVQVSLAALCQTCCLTRYLYARAEQTESSDISLLLHVTNFVVLEGKYCFIRSAHREFIPRLN